MRLDRGIHDRQILAVVHHIQHRHLKACRPSDGCFARFQINLHPEPFGKRLQPRRQPVHRITLAREMNPTTQTHPFQPRQQAAELLLDPRQLPVEQIEIVILAIVMDHEAGNPVHHPLDLARIPLAQSRKRPRRIGKVKAARRKPRVQPQPARDAGGLVVEPLQLAHGIEDDLVGITHRFGHFIIGPCHRIGMCLLAELLAPQPQFIQAR